MPEEKERLSRAKGLPHGSSHQRVSGKQWLLDGEVGIVAYDLLFSILHCYTTLQGGFWLREEEEERKRAGGSSTKRTSKCESGRFETSNLIDSFLWSLAAPVGS